MHALPSHHRPSSERITPRPSTHPGRMAVRTRTIEIMQMTRLRVTEYLHMPDDEPAPRPGPVVQPRPAAVLSRPPAKPKIPSGKPAAAGRPRNSYPRIAA